MRLLKYICAFLCATVVVLAIEVFFLAFFGLRPDWYIKPIYYDANTQKLEIELQNYANKICKENSCDQIKIKIFKLTIQPIAPAFSSVFNQQTIFAQKDFLNKLTLAEQRFVVAHEIGHIVLKHKAGVYIQQEIEADEFAANNISARTGIRTLLKTLEIETVEKVYFPHLHSRIVALMAVEKQQIAAS